VTVYPPRLVGSGRLPDRIAGRVNLYPEVRYFGSAAAFPHSDGGFCEYKAVPVDQLLPLPAGVDTRHGALAEPLGVAIHAVRRAIAVYGPLGGEPVLVNGTGPIGALVVGALKHLGARRVWASDITPASLAVARAMGADQVVNAATDPLPDDVPLVFEASGVPAALGGVLRATAPGGVLVQVGNLSAAPAKAVLGNLVTREITWIGSFRFVGEMDDALAMMAAGAHIDPIMTHTFPISQAGAAMAVATDRSTGASKVMHNLAPNEQE
jgi:L-idonate 5-dehydrogenase